MSKYLFDIARGQVRGARIVHKYGRNPNMSLGVKETITEAGVINWLTAPAPLRIKAGGNAADAAAGARARQVTIEGLNSSGIRASVSLATNGTSVSTASETSFWRVYRSYVSSVGTYGLNNTAAITIETTGGTAMISIAALEGQTQFAAYSVGANEDAYLNSMSIRVDSNKEVDVIMYIRNSLNDATSAPFEPVKLKLYLDAISGTYSEQFGTPYLIPAWSDIWFSGIAAANTTECSVDFDMVIFEK